MSSDKRKKVLQARIRAIREELNKIAEAENQIATTKLIGCCFKYKNSYGADSDSWWMYTRVIGQDESGLAISVTFQQRNDHEMDIKIKDVNTANFFRDTYIEITEEEFMEAWNQFKLRVVNTKVTP